ncbi:MAG TPA: outer membrane beta-barrel protein [Bacteroidia bacterium]|nr:outer membrane beta-barrel protein [Bacteroidia bacterium]
MKNKLLIILMAFSIYGVAQTSDKKNNISVGGGKESYNGNLGSSWFNLSEEWYGFVNISYSRYINKSFDAMVNASMGDIGRCRADDASLSVLNLYARMTTVVVTAKYKFANGYVLKEDSKIAPYIFLGAGYNYVVDIWNHKDCNAGSNLTLNGGLGVTYNICQRYNIGYRMGIGYFTKSGAVDYRTTGMHPMFMQHTFCVGVNF